MRAAMVIVSMVTAYPASVEAGMPIYKGGNTALRKVHATPGLRLSGGSHLARVLPIERVFWRSPPILPAYPVSTRRNPATYSPISVFINMHQIALKAKKVGA